MKKTTLRHLALEFSPESGQPSTWPDYSSLQSKRHVALWFGHSQAWPKPSLGPGRMRHLALGQAEASALPERHLVLGRSDARVRPQRHLALGRSD